MLEISKYWNCIDKYKIFKVFELKFRQKSVTKTQHYSTTQRSTHNSRTLALTMNPNNANMGCLSSQFVFSSVCVFVCERYSEAERNMREGNTQWIATVGNQLVACKVYVLIYVLFCFVFVFGYFFSLYIYSLALSLVHQNPEKPHICLGLHQMFIHNYATN